MLAREWLIGGAGIAALTFVATLPAASESVEANQVYRTNTHTFQDGSTATVRWDPAQAEVTVRANPNALPKKRRAGAVRDVKKALGHLSKATGIKFAYKGKTNQMPRGANWQESMPSEVLIAWTNPSKRAYRSDKLSKSNGRWVAGTGGYSFKGWGHSPSTKKNTQTGTTETVWKWKGAIGRGFVVLNAAQDKVFKPGFGSGVTRGNLLLHELGHVVGLSHVNSKSSIMYPVIISRSKAGYRSGDLAGLQQVGRSQGGLDAPEWVWRQI